ncbi:hypothetical protein [Flavobacterium sp.]|uniref:hypothetical protein n=1 Tax=Flavobacterium sp. TaxID=239 RepID=UPI0026311B34|nr:hypothetical protein [Flavobacterium sp.]
MFLDYLFELINLCRKSHFWLALPIGAVVCLLMYFAVPYDPLPIPEFVAKRLLDISLSLAVMSIGFIGYDILMHPKLGKMYPIPHLFILACIVAGLLIQILTLGHSIF